MELNDFLNQVKDNNPGQNQFHQAVAEVMQDVFPLIKDRPEYWDFMIPQRLAEPDRIIQFRVTWQDKKGGVHVNRAWRVQYNNAMGPYKGGLRFHPSVEVGTLKFLGFEQTFKNALTGLQMGGGKGGSDLNPKGKTDADVMRFCHAFMMELYKHIGPNTDVPAGDIGVGEREIGYLFGAYKKITDQFQGALTGKNPGYGGSCIRKEATGYGCAYFLEDVLKARNEDLEGKVCSLSGAGNVALYTAKKLLQGGAKVITMSDSGGFIHIPDGLSDEMLEELIRIKEVERGSVKDLCETYKACKFYKDKKPWDVEADIAIPCATQNEVEEEDAKNLKKNDISIVCEAANMPLTAQATDYLRDNDVQILPSKAVNAGGVTVSGLERTQNSQHMQWDSGRVDEELQSVMQNIHKLCLEHGEGHNYIRGANIAGFKRVASAMMAYGAI